MSDLNFNHLYYFFVIASEGSIVRASKRLHLTQPTLSSQLRQLEEYLGFQLFDRKVRKLQLNDRGEFVMTYARRIFNLADEMVQGVRSQDGQKVKIIRVGMLLSLSRTTAHQLLLPLLDRDGVMLSVREGTLPYLVRELELGNVDLVMGDDPEPYSGKKFECVRIKQRKYIVVGNKDFGGLKQGFPKSLNRVPLATFTESSQLRAHIDHFFVSRKIYPSLIAECDDISLLKAIAENGRGVSILPQHSVIEPLNQGGLLELGTITSLNAHVWALIRENDIDARRLIPQVRAGVKGL